MPDDRRQVFGRLSGESYPVEDPGTLRRLFERGEARASEAEAEALRAARDPDVELRTRMAIPCRGDSSELRLRLAFGATGRPEDVGGRLFTRSYCQRLITAAERLPAAPLFPYPARGTFSYRTTQDSVIVQEASEDNRQRWTLQARWDGSVAAYLDLNPWPDDNPSLIDGAIFGKAVAPAAAALSDLVTALGGYGRAHVGLVVYSHDFEIVSINNNVGKIPEPGTMQPIQTWTDGDGVLSNEELDRMRRELCRASGAVVWEPEPEATEDGS